MSNLRFRHEGLRTADTLLHHANATFGRILWELLTRPDLSPALAVVAEEIEKYRRQRNVALAVQLWQVAGMPGDPSDEFEATVLAHLGPLFTAAVRRDAGGDHETAATLAESAVLAAISAARSAPS
jgi:hypothetical protein